MSDAFYQKMADTSLNLIKRFGSEIRFEYEENRVFDPVEGEYTQGSQSHGSLFGLIQPAANGKVSGWKDDTFFGENLRIDKQRLLVLEAKSSAYVPKAGHSVQIDGTTFKVLGVTAIAPAGIPIVYKVGVQM